MVSRVLRRFRVCSNEPVWWKFYGVHMAGGWLGVERGGSKYWHYAPWFGGPGVAPEERCKRCASMGTGRLVRTGVWRSTCAGGSAVAKGLANIGGGQHKKFSQWRRS